MVAGSGFQHSVRFAAERGDERDPGTLKEAYPSDETGVYDQRSGAMKVPFRNTLSNMASWLETTELTKKS